MTAEKKLKFVEQLFTKGRGKSQKEMMAYLMPMMKKAKAEYHLYHLHHFLHLFEVCYHAFDILYPAALLRPAEGQHLVSSVHDAFRPWAG